MQRKYENYNPDYSDFYEEVSSANDTHFDFKDTLDTRNSDHPGLSEDSVHKLAEDMFNPIPPSDNDLY